MTSKEKIQLGSIVLGVGLLAVLLPLNSQMMRKKREARRAKLAELTAESSPTVEAVSGGLAREGAPLEGALLEKQLAVLKEPWGKSPFQAGGEQAPAGAVAHLQLKGISLLKGRPAMAIINDAIVKEGDSLEGYLVKRIERAEVTLQQGEEEVVLKLPEEELR